MIDDSIVKSFRDRYKDIHPLVFHRSVEKSESPTELFEILESIPSVPFFWDDSTKRWSKLSDFYFISKVKDIIKNED